MEKKIPMRSCAGCGEKKSKKELVRIVRTPEGTVKVDRSGRANGRGTYLCDNPECLAKARKRHSLFRALGTEIPPEVYDQLEEELSHGE